MESALDGAKWLLGKVLNLLTEDLVAGYVASGNLGLRVDNIKMELMNTLALLHAAQMRGVSDSDSGLQGLLQELQKKADEAEDVLDELHYFRVRDKLDGTRKFDPRVRGQVVHGRHALHHAVGNCFSCFSCFSTQDLGRVALSNNIKLVLEDMQSLCERISRLLIINASSNPVGNIGINMGEQRITTSITQPIKLYGRDVILNQTISDMTSGITHHETLCVLPIFGMGGVGKTTFAQHLYSHKKIEEHFTVRAWVCVSTNFDVLRLTKEILDCIPAEKSDDSNRTYESNSLHLRQQSIVERLKSKRFLIVLDDIWECSPRQWEDLLAPLKKSESEKGSMVLVTTRYRGIAQDVKTNNWIHLEGLKTRDIMKLFQDYVFDQAPAGHDHECMIEIAQQIAPKLKGSPLAATTVGRLLKKNFSQDHWKGILERKEWLDGKDADGILPALKISYSYLPFHLKKCFLYFGLFPEDYRFHNLNITQFWVAIGIIDSNDKSEVIGLNYLEEFVDCGFLVKEGDESNPSYVMHDLLHELSQSVSSHECANITSTSLRADDIPESIHHLSITIAQSDGDFEEEMDRLRRRVDIGSLRSLMIFGDISANNIVTILQNTFDEMKRLRVLSIILRSDAPWPQNFSKLIHLRYLKISYPHLFPLRCNAVVSVPTTISALHHLKFLEIRYREFDSVNVPTTFSRLVSLRHFIADGAIKFIIPKVGEMKYLQQLKNFHVKKETDGFELDQLGKLKELGGNLCICGLEKVETMKEASKADLRRKKNLQELTLQWAWDSMQLDQAADVIDGLEPHPNLRKLSIKYHPGAIGPRWLCCDICTTSLESLHLNDISWNVLPPLGLLPHLKELRLSSIAGMSQFGPDFGCVTEKSSTSLKKIELRMMPDLVKWVGGANNYHFFSRLERIECIRCPKLSGLPFSECTDPSKQETNTVWFPNLCSLTILDCPELSLPPLPHTSTLTDVEVHNREGYLKLTYEECKLHIVKYGGALAFDNLDYVETFWIRDAPRISLIELQKLHSLRDLSIHEVEIDFLFSGDNLVLSSVQKLSVETFHPIGKLLPHVLKCFPDLLELKMKLFNNEAEYEEHVLPQFPSCSSLSKVTFVECGNLVLPLEDGGGFGGLTSIESLEFQKCGKIFSRWSTCDVSDHRIIINPFPTSLRELRISYEPSMRSMDLIENLTSLTHLYLEQCPNLTVDGFNPHITLNLKHLLVLDSGENRSVAADPHITFNLQQLARLEELEFSVCSSLQCLP